MGSRGPLGVWAVLPKEALLSSGAWSGPSIGTESVRSGAEMPRGTTQLSADAGVSLTCPRQECSLAESTRPVPGLWRGAGPGVARTGPQVKGARVRLRQSSLSSLHSRGSRPDPHRNSSCD